MLPGLSPDNAALRAQIVRLEGSLESARNNETRAKQNAQNSMLESQDLLQKIALLEGRLREAMSNARGLPSQLSRVKLFQTRMPLTKKLHN